MANALNNKNIAPKIFYTITAIAGIVQGYLAIEIYRKTIIKVGIPILILISVGFLFYFIIKSHYNRLYSIGGFFFPLVQGILSAGCTACFSFLFLNYYFSDDESIEDTFPIQSKYSIPGGRANRSVRVPVATIFYYGLQKDLIFYGEDEKLFKAVDSVKIIIKGGLFGFDIIESFMKEK